jgi:hypothetical protein
MISLSVLELYKVGPVELLILPVILLAFEVDALVFRRFVGDSSIIDAQQSPTQQNETLARVACEFFAWQSSSPSAPQSRC